MKGVIIAGGLGTRLHPITLEIPKALLTVKRKPIIQYLVELMRDSGVEEIFVLVNKNDASLFKQWKKAYHNDDVTLIQEETRLGTWGGIKKYLHKELSDTFLVSNADELKETDIIAKYKFHKEKGALVTIATVEVTNPREYGVLVSDGEGRVLEFHYKPQNPPTNYIMSGIYIAEPELFDLSHDEEVISFEEEVLPCVIEKGKLYEFRSNGRWYDCGTFERYERAIKEWDKEASQ